MGRETALSRSIKMSTTMSYLIGGLIGLAFGTLVAYLNTTLTKHYIRTNGERKEPEGTGKALAFSFGRQLIDIAALCIVFFTRKLIPFPFLSTLIGTAVGLTLVSYLFLYYMVKKEERKSEQEVRK
jgi:drug/metabolite transporter (DMT)-like permease